MTQHARPASVVTLDFQSHPASGPAAAAKVIRADLSACDMVGSCLWLGCDEMTTVERLTTRDGARFAQHRAFSLGRIFDLPAGDDQEIDIEGLAHDGAYLWITGSHSLKRKKPRRHEKDPKEALRRLSIVEADPNRYFLARVPLVPTEDGRVHDLARSGISGATAACLPMASGTNALAKALAADPLFGRFVNIPCKENGLDIEGIAVRDDRVFLGLRGPVLRGWATIIEVEVRTESSQVLALNPIGPRGEAYRSHFLDLDGLGIRDLTLDGDDLLVLAGPTMDLDGPSRIYHWPSALEAGTCEVVTHDRLGHLLDVPYGDGVDRAEGLALIKPDGAARRVLVVYDSPAPSRLHSDGNAIDADVFVLPSRRTP
jgi:Protein of unknown function (DUF3616)